MIELEGIQLEGVIHLHESTPVGLSAIRKHCTISRWRMALFVSHTVSFSNARIYQVKYINTTLDLLMPNQRSTLSDERKYTLSILEDNTQKFLCSKQPD
jgi:hypothetical protein